MVHQDWNKLAEYMFDNSLKIDYLYDLKSNQIQNKHNINYMDKYIVLVQFSVCQTG